VIGGSAAIVDVLTMMPDGIAFVPTSSNARDDVRSEALDRAPFETLRTVGCNVLRRRVEAVGHRTPRRRRPETLALRGENGISAGEGAIGHGPVSVRKIIVIGGVLDHPIE
jgi:hypothetical protein